MKTNLPYIIIGALVLALLLVLFKQCGQPKTLATDPATIEQLKKDTAVLHERIRKDSLRYAWYRDSSEEQRQMHYDNAALQANVIRNNGKRINQLIAQIRSISDDSPRIAYQQPCEELADSVEAAQKQLSDLYATARLLETNYQQQFQQSDSAIADLRGSLRTAITQRDTCLAVVSRMSQDKPRNQVYIGATGVYNPLVYGAGASVMLKTKRDRVYQVGYLVTNDKPMYQVGALFKISFRR